MFKGLKQEGGCNRPRGDWGDRDRKGEKENEAIRILADCG